MPILPVVFAGGDDGVWRVARLAAIVGPPLAVVSHVPVLEGTRTAPTGAWRSLAQDERRALFEERSRHVATGLAYLPAIARRLHHSRDLGGAVRPHETGLRSHRPMSPRRPVGRNAAASEEWRFVEREVEIRLAR
jgi:hypothetical protein